MGRPKGSVNKPKMEVSMAGELYMPEPKEKSCRHLKEKQLQTAPVVEKIKRPVKPKVIPTTTNSVEEKQMVLSGELCVELVITGSKVIKGFVNVQRNQYGSYYLGGDIHETLEKAKAVASKPTITQLYVAFEVKE